MKYRSVFDIIGPVMVGPSSSHTAGAVRIGRIAGRLFGKKIEKANIHFYGSFAKTYRGHATDVAVLAGLMDLSTYDPRIPEAFDLADKAGFEYNFFEEKALSKHPNTVQIEMFSGDTKGVVTGVSLGGGIVQITEVDGFPLKLSGDFPALLIFHQDIYGTIAPVVTLLAENQINVSHMEVSRLEKGYLALMAIETDQPVSEAIVAEMLKKPNIKRIVRLS
ncbi:MAG: L-serine ammonia-lyase, iron-sulfur-dependent subunit beta [Eubacteriales bacterium]|nr:L-serine ammonia-lyase, iron-sulfur-dependent subunit beta [Eubacteriales bacterium]